MRDFLDRDALLRAMAQAEDPSDLNDLLNVVEPLIRADERDRIAAVLWACIEPITTWIANVNTARIARSRGDE